MVVWRTLSLFPKLQWRAYHTKNCFGHWKKPYIQNQPVSEQWLNTRAKEANLYRLVAGYQNYGHKKGDVNPLNIQIRPELPELQPEYYGLDSSNSKLYDTTGILFGFNQNHAVLTDIIAYLEKMYCSTLTLEASHLTDPSEREWLLQCYEQNRFNELPLEFQLKLAKQLLKSQVFDNFLAKKFGTVKRYGAEGAESMIGFFDEVLRQAIKMGMSDVIICMPHRGRLNLLTGLLEFSPSHMFYKIKGNPEFPADVPGTGDVLSHLVSSFDIDDHETTLDNSLHITMVPNPSHLDAVNPVAMGKARARMLTRQSGPYHKEQNDKGKVLCLQVHGDASYAAQGINMECLAISNVPHYELGGSVHLIVNNYLGFTTPAEYGRSSSYCSDVAKMNGCPVLHVNGNHPEEVVRACHIAMEYRLQFEKDVFVVLNCYRKWGHNELDDPSMTQPSMYKAIDTHSSVPDTYWDQLQSNSDNIEDKETFSDEVYEILNKSFKKADDYKPDVSHLQAQWTGLEHPSDKITHWDTGLAAELLKYIGAKSVEVPETFVVHPRLKKTHIENRLNMLNEGTKLDWATAEALAVGSLLYQGFNVRLSGQDVGRGTFSHRHMMLVDQETDEAYITLNQLSDSQTNFLEIANSPLSEEAVLGFEYGYSIDNPKHCVIWEAQFGDFFNGAQVIIDTFISSGEDKWLLQSGLVMLLPHGYDGAGPEHSSCRIERFLQMTDSLEEGPDGDNVNMHIVHPTTPAQYFHLLRRQMLRNFRKPLIVQSPKILLRLPEAASSLADMSPGTCFKPVLGDVTVDPKLVKKVVLCSGKHFYALDSYRRKHNIQDTALIRLELLCPFPSGALYEELTKYTNVKEFLWSQEEPSNMGPWFFVEPRFRKQLGITLNRVSRKPYGPPAVGISKIHQSEAKQLLIETFPL